MRYVFKDVLILLGFKVLEVIVELEKFSEYLFLNLIVRNLDFVGLIKENVILYLRGFFIFNSVKIFLVE